MNRERYNLLDIIKGIMILFIIITHFQFVYPDDYKKYGFFFWIDMAVPVFMVITGYLYALQYEKKNIESFEQAWSVELIVPKILRFIVPLIPAIILETIVLYIVRKISFVEIVNLFARGGLGPGSYYTLVLIQLIFFFPIIYFIIKKYDICGVVISFFLTGFWELIQYSWEMNDYAYAVLVFRYMSIVAFGCYIAIGKKKIKKVFLLSIFILGVIWQTMLNYIPLHPVFMNYSWARVNYLSALLVMPIIYVLIDNYNKSKIDIPLFQELGKASFNIYIVQMVFYGCGPAQIIYRYINKKYIQLSICIIICCSVGYIYYMLESSITKNIISYLRKKKYFKNRVVNAINKCNDFIDKE